MTVWYGREVTGGPVSHGGSLYRCSLSGLAGFEGPHCTGPGHKRCILGAVLAFLKSRGGMTRGVIKTCQRLGQLLNEARSDANRGDSEIELSHSYAGAGPAQDSDIGGGTPMSRTRLFKRIRQAIRQIEFARHQGMSQEHLQDRLAVAGEARSRRDFLKASALMAATPIMNGAPSILYRDPASVPSSKADRVLILGAGAAGLATAHTLRKAGVPFRILEASSRVGGRIYTQFGFNSENQFIERGAELVDTGHKHLISLAQEMGLEIEDFTSSDAGVEAELFYFGGQIYTDKNLHEKLAPLLDAVKLAKEQGARSFTHSEAAANPHLVKWDRLSIAQFLDGLKGQVDDWVLAAVGVAYLGEMGRELGEQSSLNLLPLIDTDLGDGFSMFGESDESKRIKGGNMLLPLKLRDAIVRRNEGAIRYGSRVAAISQRGSKIVVSVAVGDRIYEETASQVICTLPFSVLREIDGLEKLDLKKEKLAAIREMGYGENSKIMMEFRERTWRKPGKVAASTGMLYGDFTSQAFWETSRLQGGRHGIITNFLGGRAGERATRDSIQQRSLRDLTKVHGELEKLFVKGVVQNWNRVPTARGSYICMMPGQFSLFNGAQAETEMNGRLIFAGEHTSEESAGFMNGGYESGIRAAEEIISSRKIKAPKKKGA